MENIYNVWWFSLQPETTIKLGNVLQSKRQKDFGIRYSWNKYIVFLDKWWMTLSESNKESIYIQYKFLK